MEAVTLSSATAFPLSSPTVLQVVKNAKQTQARKTKGGYADDDTKPAEEPKRWSDYTVSHAPPRFWNCAVRLQGLGHRVHVHQRRDASLCIHGRQSTAVH